MVGYEPDKVWLAVIPGDGSATMTLEFPVGKQGQDSFSSVPVTIQVDPITCTGEGDEPLEGCKVIEGCSSISLNDGATDAFHMYWNNDRKILMWWRL